MTGLRVAIVGAGSMGSTHARAVAARADVVAAVVDADAARRGALAARYGAASLGALDELDDGAVDAVVVATPPHAHLALTLDCVRRGFACLVEKPHRLPFQDQSGLIAALDGARRPCRVGMTTRHSPGIAAVRAAVAAGELGDVLEVRDQIWFTLGPDTLPAWYFDRSLSGGGVLAANGVHALDRVAWLLGEPLAVDSSQLRTVIAGHEVDDHVFLAGSGRASRVPFSISLLWSDYDNGGSRLTVAGTDGHADVHADGSWQVVSRAGARSGSAGDPDEPFRRQWTSFAGAVSGSATDDGPGPLELEPTLAVIEALYTTRDAASEVVGG